MELVWYCVFVLLITTSIFYFPALIVIIAHHIYKFFTVKNEIFIWVFSFLFGYVFISLFGVGIYYYFSDFNNALSTTATRTDVVYIFTACATLCAPILVLLTLNLWRQQYRTSLNKEVTISLIKEIEELKQVLLETYELMKSIESNFRRNMMVLSQEQKKLGNEANIERISKEIKDGYLAQMSNLLQINTYKIFQKKCEVFKYSTIIRMGSKILSDEPEEVEKITIRASQIIHAVHSKAINYNQALSQDDLDSYYECLIDLKRIVENIIYPKLKQDLYLIKNPL